MKTPVYTRAQALPEILKTRIAILDGAMGTMIQRFKLTEADYRGERFKDFPKDVKGNNELLSLTRPDVIQDIHEGYLAAGADFVLIGRAAILHHDFPTLAANPDFEPIPLPVTREHLVAEGLGPAFVAYMDTWKGFVAPVEQAAE